MLSDHFREPDIQDLTVIATDVGGAKKAHNIARVLRTPLAIGEKERLGHTGEPKVRTVPVRV
jgi:phosphoribosylpyrophosphate synthetase